MNKKLMFVHVSIVIVSAIALVYFASNPVVDNCATHQGAWGGLTVCHREETTNWLGIDASLAMLGVGTALAIYTFIRHKKNL